MDLFENIRNELTVIVTDLNITYMLMYSLVLYGIKNKEEFKWYNSLLDRNKDIKPFKVWIAGVFMMLVHCLFKFLESGELSASYVSQLLRSFVIVIVLNSVFTKKIKEIDT